MTIGVSTANAEIVAIAAPGSTDGTLWTGAVTISGNSTALISTASRVRIESTAALSVDNISTASRIRIESTASLTVGGITTASKIQTEETAVVQVEDNGGSLTIDGNSTAIISTASKIRVESTAAMPVSFTTGSKGIAELSTTGMGGSTGTPVFIRSTGGAGTDVNVTNSSMPPTPLSTVGMGGSSANPVWTAIGNVSSVTIQGGQSTALISTASVIRVDSIASFPANSSNVVISGNSTALISTASKIQAELVTGFGAGSSNPIITRDWAPRSESTWANITLTSTTATELMSSGGSTVLNITDLQATVGSTATGTLVRVYDNSTAGTLLFAGWCGPEGGINATFLTPRRGSSGENIVAVLEPASTVYISVGGFRSS